MAFKCACCLYQDSIIITAQILLVVVFCLDIWGCKEVWIPGILACLILLFGTCCDIYKIGFYAALFISVIAALGCMFTMIFVEERHIEEDCENDNGSVDDEWYCETSNLYTLFTMGLVLHLIVAALIMHFLASGRYSKFQEESRRRQSIHPVNPPANDEADDNAEDATEKNVDKSKE